MNDECCTKMYVLVWPRASKQRKLDPWGNQNIQETDNPLLPRFFFLLSIPGNYLHTTTTVLLIDMILSKFSKHNENDQQVPSSW